MSAITTDPEGYSIVLCDCAEGPHIGARRLGDIDRCERCWRVTPDQWDALRRAALATPDPALQPTRTSRSEETA